MYTLANYAIIQKSMSYQLSPSVKKQLQYLIKELGIEEEFTLVSKPKTITQDIIREVNKLTLDNKKTQIPHILSLLTNENVLECSTLLDILCDNSFFSSLYVELFLQFKWDIFKEQFDCKFKQFILNLQNIQVGDSENYEEYCEFKKINNSLKNFTLFITNLQQTELYLPYYQETLSLLFSLIDTSLELNKKDIVNELIDHVYLMALPNHHFSVSKIDHYSKLNITNYKFIFKCLDILKKVDLK